MASRPPRGWLSPGRLSNLSQGCLALVGVGVLLILLLLVISPSLPPTRERRERARLAWCLSNVKQMGLAFDMYLQDWDDRLPPRAGWTDRLQPYPGNDSLLRCPGIREPRPEASGYAYNSRFAGVARATIAPDPTLPLAFDSTKPIRSPLAPIPLATEGTEPSFWTIGFALSRHCLVTADDGSAPPCRIAFARHRRSRHRVADRLSAWYTRRVA